MNLQNPTLEQAEMLRLLDRRGATPQEELDGRTVKALLGRGWARQARKGIEITSAGREVAVGNTQERRTEHPRAKIGGRSQAILQAVEKFEVTVPPDSELAVGPMFAHVDDVLDGFRRLARQIAVHPCPRLEGHAHPQIPAARIKCNFAANPRVSSIAAVRTRSSVISGNSPSSTKPTSQTGSLPRLQEMSVLQLTADPRRRARADPASAVCSIRVSSATVLRRGALGVSP